LPVWISFCFRYKFETLWWRKVSVSPQSLISLLVRSFYKIRYPLASVPPRDWCRYHWFKAVQYRTKEQSVDSLCIFTFPFSRSLLGMSFTRSGIFDRKAGKWRYRPVSIVDSSGRCHYVVHCAVQDDSRRRSCRGGRRTAHVYFYPLCHDPRFKSSPLWTTAAPAQRLVVAVVALAMTGPCTLQPPCKP
jgi:hypothetical protein